MSPSPAIKDKIFPAYLPVGSPGVQSQRPATLVASTDQASPTHRGESQPGSAATSWLRRHSETILPGI